MPSYQFNATTIANSQANFAGINPTSVQELQLIAGVQWRFTVSDVGAAATFKMTVEQMAYPARTWTKIGEHMLQSLTQIYSYAVIGTTVFILTHGTNGSPRPAMYRYETTTDTVTGPFFGPLGLGNAEQHTLTAFPDGTLLATQTNQNTGLTLVALKFNPGSNTFSAATTLVTIGATGQIPLDPVGAVLQPSTGLVFLFYVKTNANTFDIDIRCLTVDTTLAAGTDEFVATVVIGSTGNPNLWNLGIGTPTITNDPAAPQVLIPFCNGFDGTHFTELQAARANCSTSPAFSVETIDTLAAGLFFVTFSGAGVPFVPALLDQAGTVYGLATVSNDVDNAGAMTQLNWYTSPAAATWVKHGFAFQAPVGSGAISPFLALDPGGLVAAVLATMNWVTWTGGGDQFPGLAVFYLFQTPIAAIASPTNLGPGNAGGRFRCCPPTSEKMQQIIEGGELVRRMVAEAECWPWDHVEAPPDAVHLDPLAKFIAGPAPAVGVRTPILTYTVPTGFKLMLKGILQDVFGAAPFNPGDALWTVDQLIVPGFVGSPVQGLTLLPVPLGNFPRGVWWEFERAYEFAQLVEIRSTVTNVNLGTGPPIYFASAFLGYLVRAK